MTLDVQNPSASDILPPLRPPAVPLIACDPYFSIWSFANKITQEPTKHWTGAVQSLASLICIDGVCYRLMGSEPGNTPDLPQVRLDVLPTRTVYEFAGAGVNVTLTFLTSSLPHDLDKLSRPVAYITWDVRATDNNQHAVSLYFDATATLATNTQYDPVTWGHLELDGLDVLYTGSLTQPVLEKSGDDLRIDWGYLYSISPDAGATGFVSVPRKTRRMFAATGDLPDGDLFTMPQAARHTALVWLMHLGQVDNTGTKRTVILAYDDRFSVEYLHRKLRPYWRRLGWNADDLLRAAIREQDDLMVQCAAYDAKLMHDLTAAGGPKYARLCALAFRQCLAAHKLVADFDGTPLFFSKENFSNGCIATVDITYPTSPFYLLFNPELLKGAMRPVLEYASLPRWRFPFAPHDLGTYPLANGQVYGGGERNEENQMPVEESGNMLIMAAALAVITQDTSFLNPYRPLLQRWAEYLRDYGFDPENQLCTDDFAGHLAHNANLSIKAILGLASYARLCELSRRVDSGRRKAALSRRG